MTPSSVQAALDFGLNLIFGGRIIEAVAHFEAAIARHPDSLDLQFTLANLLTDSGAAASALPIYQRLLTFAFAPENAVLANYGIALYKAGRPREAAECLERVVSRDHENIFAHFVLQRAMADTGRTAEAREQGIRILQKRDAKALSSADPDAGIGMRSRVAQLDWTTIEAKPRVIALSLWGAQPRFLDGMLITCALAARFYRGWTVRVYADETVPATIVSKLRDRGAEVIAMPIPENRQVARLWRFMVADDPRIGRFLCRDCDTPILPKEANAVSEWIRSGKPFHLMRDHLHHTDLILAGMWGGIAGLLPPLTPKIDTFAATKRNPLNLMIDQIFLAEQVWPLLREHAFVHDTPFQFGGLPLSEVDVASGVGSDVPLEWGYSRHGIMVWLKLDAVIGKSLREYGEWSEAELTLLSKYVARGDFIVEGGSNVGAHTLALARAVGPDGQVVAFEPQAEICRILVYNAGINGLTNVDARHCALGAATGLTSIAVPDYGVLQNFGGLSTGHGAVKVEMVALDDLEFDRLNLLKLDVAGHELDVLAGAARTIARFRPIIYLENDRKERADALIGFIRQMGYQLWWHTPFLYSPENARGRQVDVFPGTVSINMLCLPRERPLPVPLQLEPVSDGSPGWPRGVA